MDTQAKNEQVVYPELSYRLVGCAYTVFNALGFGLSEKTYQKAYAEELALASLKFVRERMVVLSYRDKPLAKFFLDFDVEDKIIIELKVRPRLGYIDIKQTQQYLKITGYKLAILIYYTKEGVKYRRILNVR